LLGDLEILRILKNKYDADYTLKTENGLTPLHCAVQ
jgi:hypothetical protein